METLKKKSIKRNRALHVVRGSKYQYCTTWRILYKCTGMLARRQDLNTQNARNYECRPDQCDPRRHNHYSCSRIRRTTAVLRRYLQGITVRLDIVHKCRQTAIIDTKIAPMRITYNSHTMHPACTLGACQQDSPWDGCLDAGQAVPLSQERLGQRE